MRLYLDIKPKQIIIKTRHSYLHRQLAGNEAISRVANRACFSIGGDGKISWSANTDINNKNVYVYNVEYRKRGKYKNNKHFVVYVYTFSVEMLKVLGLSIEQKHYNFKLYKTDRNGKKIYL